MGWNRKGEIKASKNFDIEVWSVWDFIYRPNNRVFFLLNGILPQIY